MAEYALIGGSTKAGLVRSMTERGMARIPGVSRFFPTLRDKGHSFKAGSALLHDSC